MSVCQRELWWGEMKPYNGIHCIYNCLGYVCCFRSIAPQQGGGEQKQLSSGHESKGGKNKAKEGRNGTGKWMVQEGGGLEYGTE